MTPQRIQLRRTKGWKMPEGAVNVARPSRWGNPHSIREGRDRATCIRLFNDSVRGIWNPTTVAHLSHELALESYHAHHRWLRRLGGHPLELVTLLRGKDLICWCKPGEPCHADVLLELANQ